MEINLPIDPPVNNNIQSTVYDKLDQIAFERIRVANNQLDTRLTIQEKILNKHRKDVERVHTHQAERLKREVRKIRQKKPDYVYDDSDVSTSRSRAPVDTGRKRCMSEPPCNLSYCRRYYAHHYNIGSDKKTETEEATGPPKKRNDFFNTAFRLYFINIMKNGRGQSRELEPNTLQGDDLGRSLDSSMLTSPRRGLDNSPRESWLNAQSSVDDFRSDDDDVFGLSHSSFRPHLNTFKSRHSLDCLVENKEPVTESDVVGVEKRRANLKKRHSESGTTKIRRRQSKVTETDIANYSSGLRKTKKDFEKLFAGLL